MLAPMEKQLIDSVGQWRMLTPGRTRVATAMLVLATILLACEPTVRLEVPREPITINLNIKADIRVRIEEQAKKDIEANEKIF